MLLNQFECSHTASRAKAKLKLSDLRIMPLRIPNGATHYRVLNHLSIISDYTYSEINQRFEPLSRMNTLNAIAFSEYIPVCTHLTDEIVVSLPVSETLPDDVSVIQCVGVVFYFVSGPDNYLIINGGSIMVFNVF